jgi:ABC-type protease/lipase transport system fused ATPase/permease subunit
VHIQSDNDQFQPLISDINAPLRVKNLKKRFGTLEVLKGISMTAQRGDVISILGSSGSGKSTLLRSRLVDYSVWKAFLESKMVRCDGYALRPQNFGRAFGPGVGIGLRKQDKQLAELFNSAIEAIEAP